MRKAGGETAKEVCNRASDARCAGVPNLGRIGVDVEDFLPQLCGGTGGTPANGASGTQARACAHSIWTSTSNAISVVSSI